jgi:transcription elongation factor B subunit 1
MSRADLLAHFADSDSDNSAHEGNAHPEEEEFRDPPPDPVEYVLLISSDGLRFHVPKEVAKVSALLASLFDPEAEFAESISGEVHLDRIRGVVLERVIDYMHFNYIWRSHCSRMPRFSVDQAITVETFIVADFLQL